jgi:chloride channel protein, CIC family
LRSLLQNYRFHLTDPNSVLAYAVLGLLGGLASGLIVLAFEFAIIQLAAVFSVGSQGEGFEALEPWLQFSLPAAGALLLGLIYSRLSPEDRETGIVHVISRMHAHYSVLPLKNTIVQFAAGALALATGQSGGREGPGVHLGGAVNSLAGQWLKLPNNSLRILIACGTAGGISAAFQTPLAGVIFAMEVIIAEYTVIGFLPVMLAAVSASAISRLFSPDGVFPSLPVLELNSLIELPALLLLGLLCGFAVSIFIKLSAWAAQFGHRSVILRFTVAGSLTGLLALWAPEILGVGYDTLALALDGKIALTALATIALCKLIATAVTCGVGMPVGLIAPNLVIGACIGGLVGAVMSAIDPQLASHPALYIVIGMGAAMGAVLNAPLAAILAVIELTHTIGISMAAMLAIVAATLTNSGLFKQRSAHQTVLHQLRRIVPDDPLNQLLHRSNVTTTMDSRVVRVPVNLDQEGYEVLLGAAPTWCVLERESEDLYLVQASELIEWLRASLAETEEVDITEADIRRWTIASVPSQATLKQAVDAMSQETTEAACVYERSTRTGRPLLLGVVTRESIEKFSLSGLG